MTRMNAKRIDRSWRVFASIENAEQDRCVDLFSRPDGNCGFEEFRRDPEDAGDWTAVQYYAALAFPSRREALAEAVRSVIWLREALEESELVKQLLASPRTGRPA